MTTTRTVEYLVGLLNELRKLPAETEWCEFKVNDVNPEEIGEYLSALSNAAAIAGKPFSYLVWGIENVTHSVLGTSFVPTSARVGNELLENWLLRLLTPGIQFCFHEFVFEERRIVLLEIGAAFHHPTQFQKQEYVRIGSYKKKLKDYPEKESALWRVLHRTPFEVGIAAERVSGDEVIRLLDYPAYFELINRPLPGSPDGILESLKSDELINDDGAGAWNITNLGGILFAKKLSEFGSLRRKVMRVIVYRGTNRVETIKEQAGSKGYACGFQGMIDYITDILPSNEVIQQALRKTVPMYPGLAVRELVVNALIHQDFSVTGAGPMVEIFDDRMEICNPGTPLVETDRFLDSAPKSRNETLASLMRRMGICEERGSGVDKVVFETEVYQLPAPMFEATSDATRAVLFAHRPLSRMDKADRVRACYLHSCLKYVNRQFLTNTTVRERFGIKDENIAVASRLIREAVDAGAIAPHDKESPPKLMKYIPWWAVST